MSASENLPFHRLTKRLTSRFKFGRLVYQTQIFRIEVIMIVSL